MKTTWAYTARFRPHTLIACTARQAADAVDAGYVVWLMTTDELLTQPFTRSDPMFTERQIRESRCYGKPEGYVWIFPAGKAVWTDGVVTNCYIGEDKSDRLTPDEAVRLLRGRGVIEDEPAFMIGDKVEVVGPIDPRWLMHDLGINSCVGKVGKIRFVNATNLAGVVSAAIDFADGVVKWYFPLVNLRHAKAEAAQPDKWAHLPEGGEWVHCPSAACIYHVTDLTFEAFELCGLTEGVVQDSRFRLVTGDTTMTRAEAIAIFEANAAPDHIPDAGEMVTDEAHYIQEACDWREANRVAEARIAVHKQQFIDATAMAVYARECLNESRASHASCEDELYDARQDIIALRERVAAMAKGISERDSQLGELRQQLHDIQSSEVVTDAERASARAAVDLMEQVEERDATIAALELQLADARSSEGVTGAQLATAEATIAVLIQQRDEHDATITDLDKELANAEAAMADLMEQVKERDVTISELRGKIAWQDSDLAQAKKCTGQQHLEMVRNRKQMDEYEVTIDGLRKQAEGSRLQSVDNSRAILDDRVFLREATIKALGVIRSLGCGEDLSELHYAMASATMAREALAAIKRTEVSQ